MKLKNKILIAAAPIATVAALTPVAMLTSCGAMASLHIDMKDIGVWKPSEDQWTGAYTPENMQKKYYETMSAKPLLLAEDLVQNNPLLNEATTTGYYQVDVNGIDAKNHLLSYTYKMDAKSVEDDATTTIKFTTKYVNIPFSVKWVNGSYKLVCDWTQETILTAKNWAVYISFTQAGTKGKSSQKTEQIYDFSDTSTDEEKKQALTYISILGSYYMAQCTQEA